MPRRRPTIDPDWFPGCERRGYVPSQPVEPNSPSDSSTTAATDDSMEVHAYSVASGDTTLSSGWSDTDLSESYEPMTMRNMEMGRSKWTDEPDWMQTEECNQTRMSRYSGMSLDQILAECPSSTEEDTSEEERMPVTVELNRTVQVPAWMEAMYRITTTTPSPVETRYFQPSPTEYVQEGYNPEWITSSEESQNTMESGVQENNSTEEEKFFARVRELCTYDLDTLQRIDFWGNPRPAEDSMVVGDNPDEWCTVCLRRGHLTRACPARARDDARGADQTDRVDAETMEVWTECPATSYGQMVGAQYGWCSICGQEGHTAATCPMYPGAAVGTTDAETSTSEDEDATH